MKYYIIKNQKWVRAHVYNLAEMRQITLYNDDFSVMGIGLY